MHTSPMRGVLTTLLLVIIVTITITITLTGCRITGGGSGGSKKSIKFEKPITKSAAADAPLVLNNKSPKARFRVDVRNEFGDYRRKNRTWRQFFSIGSRNKTSSALLKASIYMVDGVTLLKEVRTKAVSLASMDSKAEFYFFQTMVFDKKLHPDFSSKHGLSINCSADKKVCATSYIVDIELVNRQPNSIDGMSELTVEYGAYFESKVKVDAHKNCFTFLACVDGTNVKSVRPSIKITRIK